MAAVRILSSSPSPSPSSRSSSSLANHNLPFIFVLVVFSLFPLSTCLPNEVSLLEFKAGLKNTTALDPTWQNGTSACDEKKPWLGVTCTDEGQVQSIRLMGIGLSGDINVDSLAKIDGLRALYIGGNSFTGPIPPFNKLGALKNLYIHDNNFSGEIPGDFFAKMGSLRKLGINGNNFSGKMPESLGNLPNLVELRVDDNEFSGHLPLIGQDSLQVVDFSDNNLEGEIPEKMLRFGVHPFEGNANLCGKGIKECVKASPPSNEPHPQDQKQDQHQQHQESPNNESKSSSGSGSKWVILGVVVALLLVTIVLKTRRKDDNYNTYSKENLDEMAPVAVPTTNRRSSRSSSSRKLTESGRWSRKGSQRSSGDLCIVNEEKGLFGLQDLMKAAAEVLGNGGLGSAYKAVLANGTSVVVKRLREMNKLNKDAFDGEIRRLGKLKHQNILTPLAYHYRKDEKLLVSEFIPKGSLLYLLHGDRGISHAELNWPNRLKIIQGVARGMGYLHTEFATSELPHGNLKSSNILLSTNYEPLLSDYAYYSLISNTQTAQALFAFKSPEAILYQQVTPKSDVYCLGIIILEIITGKFPSQYLNNQKGGTDLVHWVRSAINDKRETELIDPEISSVTNSLEQMRKLLHIAAACTESDHQQRLDMKEAIKRIEEINV